MPQNPNTDTRTPTQCPTSPPSPKPKRRLHNISPSLHKALLGAPYDRTEFHLRRSVVKGDRNGHKSSDEVYITQLSKNEEPLMYKIFRHDNVEDQLSDVVHDERGFPLNYRQHIFMQNAGPVAVNLNGTAGMEYRVDSFTLAKATWTVDRTNEDFSKTVYKNGFVEFKEAGMRVRVDRFVKRLGSEDEVQTAGPFAQFKGRIKIPRPESRGGGVKSFDTVVSGKYTNTLIMEAQSTADSIALKLSLTLDEEAGKLEVLTRGVADGAREYTYLKELIFALWLVFCDEDEAKFERW